MKWPKSEIILNAMAEQLTARQIRLVSNWLGVVGCEQKSEKIYQLGRQLVFLAVDLDPTVLTHAKDPNKSPLKLVPDAGDKAAAARVSPIKKRGRTVAPKLKEDGQ